MPQNGFHGLFGMLVARLVARRASSTAAEPIVAGTVMGAMTPDIDMYPTAIAVLMGRGDLTYVIHRSATHGFLAIFTLAALGLALRRRSPGAGNLCLGLALGVSTHALLDTFLWFAQIDLFWPLSHIPSLGLPIVDLWTGVRHPSPLMLNLREAFEFVAFALLLRTLTTIGRPREFDVAGMQRAERWIWGGFGVTLVTAFVFRDNARMQNYFVTTPYLLAMLPYCWWQTWRLRSAITAWAIGRHGAGK